MGYVTECTVMATQRENRETGTEGIGEKKRREKRKGEERGGQTKAISKKNSDRHVANRTRELRFFSNKLWSG